MLDALHDAIAAGLYTAVGDEGTRRLRQDVKLFETVFCLDRLGTWVTDRSNGSANTCCIADEQGMVGTASQPQFVPGLETVFGGADSHQLGMYLWVSVPPYIPLYVVVSGVWHPMRRGRVR